MANITVHYFDAHGRAEAIRVLLVHSRTQFTDHRLSFEEWGPLKSTHYSEFDQLPMVEVDGLKMAQTVAIFRYLGRKLGYIPADPVQEYQMDSLFGLRDDFIYSLMPVFRTRDQEAIDKWYEDNSAKFLGWLEARLSANNGGAGWFVGDRVTLADIWVFEWLWDSYLRPTQAKYAHYLDATPKLKAFFDRMLASSEEVREYHASRRETQF